MQPGTDGVGGGAAPPSLCRDGASPPALKHLSALPAVMTPKFQRAAKNLLERAGFRADSVLESAPVGWRAALLKISLPALVI